MAAGAVIGRGAHFAVEATLHHPNEYVLLVGESAKARKGSSWDHVARLMGAADPGFAARTSTGLSSGEGLVWALRDPAGTDPGASDPRLLVVEPEFASVLKSTGRDVSTLSPVLRSAWDGRPLALLTRTAPARARAAHLAVIGHITAVELAQHTAGIEAANGLLNRFLLIACRRARLLPEGGHPDPLAGTGLPATLATNLAAARGAGRLRFSAAARQLWWDTYPSLSEAAPGPGGALVARAEAHTVRLALLYALTDGARSIGPGHLRAGLCLWAYAARTAHWAAGQATVGPLAGRIADALIAAGPKASPVPRSATPSVATNQAPTSTPPSQPSPPTAVPRSAPPPPPAGARLRHGPAGNRSSAADRGPGARSSRQYLTTRAPKPAEGGFAPIVGRLRVGEPLLPVDVPPMGSKPSGRNNPTIITGTGQFCWRSLLVTGCFTSRPGYFGRSVVRHPRPHLRRPGHPQTTWRPTEVGHPSSWRWPSGPDDALGQ